MHIMAVLVSFIEMKCCLPGVYAYIVLKDDCTESYEDIVKDLKALVRKQIAAYAVPELIQVCMYVFFFFFFFFFLIIAVAVHQHTSPRPTNTDTGMYTCIHTEESTSCFLT